MLGWQEKMGRGQHTLTSPRKTEPSSGISRRKKSTSHPSNSQITRLSIVTTELGGEAGRGAKWKCHLHINILNQ